MIITIEDIMKSYRLDKYKEIANDYVELIDLAIKTKWENVTYKFKDFYSDEDLIDQCDDIIEMLKMFKYRMSLMVICCLCETWEQDLYNFLKENNIIVKMNNEYSIIKTKFKKFIKNIDIDNDYEKLKEMRDLVNAIKHGNGKSFDKIIKKFGNNILEDSNIGVMNSNGNRIREKQRVFDDNTLTSKTLNIDGLIDIYYNEIVRFWTEVLNKVKY